MLYIFDMGGVVCTDAAAESRVSDVLGISHEEFLRYCGCEPSVHAGQNSDGRNLLTLCSDGKISSKEFWSIFSQRSGITVKTDLWHWLFHPALNEETCALVKSLRRNGNRVVCGTNTIDSYYFNHLERGDYAIFDQTYASIFMGVSKPDPEFWRIILTAEGARPEDCVFIDDKEINCRAAESLGIRAIHFTTAGELAERLK